MTYARWWMMWLVLFWAALPGCSLFLPRSRDYDFATLATKLDDNRRDPRAPQRLAQWQPVLASARQEGKAWREAIALHNVGTAYKGMGQLDEALRYLEQARQRFEATKQLGLLAENLRITAACYAWRGDTQRALAVYEQALTAARSGVADAQGTAWLEAAIWDGMASIYGHKKDWSQAVRLGEQARARYAQAGDARRELILVIRLGSYWGAKGDVETALTRLTYVQQRSAEMSDPQLGILAAWTIALTYIGAGQLEPGFAAVEQGIALAQQAGDADAVRELSEFAGKVRAQSY